MLEPRSKGAPRPHLDFETIWGPTATQSRPCFNRVATFGRPCCDLLRFVATLFRDLGALLTRPGFDLVATQFPIHRDRVCDLGSVLSQFPCDLVATLRRPWGGPVATLLRPCGERAVISWRPRCHHVASLFSLVLCLRPCCNPRVTGPRPHVAATLRRLGGDLVPTSRRLCCDIVATPS